MSESASPIVAPRLDFSALLQLLYIGALGIVVLAGILWLLAQWNEGGAGEAVDLASRTVTLTLSQEPPQLDSTRGTDQVSFRILGHVMEGLLRYDQNDRLVGAMAERWRIDDRGATFWLRPDVYWSNGAPVTAHDFVFGWRKVLEPANASQYAFILFGIKNAEAVNSGRMPVEALAARATDDRTLEWSSNARCRTSTSSPRSPPTIRLTKRSTNPPTAATAPTRTSCSTTARS